MVDQAIVSAYSQTGGDLPYFIGKQYGSGWLRNIARIAFPILKRVGRVAAKTAGDVIMGDEKILPSLMKNTVNEVKDVVTPNKRPAKTTYKRAGKRRRVIVGKGLRGVSGL